MSEPAQSRHRKKRYLTLSCLGLHGVLLQKRDVVDHFGGQCSVSKRIAQALGSTSETTWVLERNISYIILEGGTIEKDQIGRMKGTPGPDMAWSADNKLHSFQCQYEVTKGPKLTSTRLEALSLVPIALQTRRQCKRTNLIQFPQSRCEMD